MNQIGQFKIKFGEQYLSKQLELTTNPKDIYIAPTKKIAIGYGKANQKKFKTSFTIVEDY
jgi:hypothetical protein